MRKYLTSFTDIPCKAGTVNHAMKNEMTKITDIPYKAGTVNYATTDLFWHMAEHVALVWNKERLRRRRERYRARRDRENNEERE